MFFSREDYTHVSNHDIILLTGKFGCPSQNLDDCEPESLRGQLRTCYLANFFPLTIY